jgi:hypothetical protein
MGMTMAGLNHTNPFDFDVLIPGDYVCDIVFTGLPSLPALSTEIYAEQVNVVPGGGALNSTIGLRRLGVNVGWLGKLGSDFFSHFINHLLDAEQVDMKLVTRLTTPLPRVTVALSYPEDRAFVTYEDRTGDHVDRVLRALETVSCRHVHFGGLTLDPRILDLLDYCHGRGIRVSMDCQHRHNTLAEPLVRDVLSRLDIFMPNAHETMRLTETATLDHALAVLGDLTPYLVVKQGAAGALARVNQTNYHSQARPVEVLDTTGAGDAFNSGFLAAYLQDYPPEECLRWGNYCGGESVRGIGSTTTVPTYEQLRTALELTIDR